MKKSYKEIIQKLYPDELGIIKKISIIENRFDTSNWKTVIDAGASNGNMTFYLSDKVGDDGKVYSIEANIESLNDLGRINQEYFKKNNIVVCNKALFKTSDQKIRLYKTECDTTRNIFLGLNRNISEDKYDIVETISIDDFVDRHNIKKLDFIYMNIEGAEITLIDSMENTIDNHRPDLYIIVHTNLMKPQDINRFLKKLFKILDRNEYTYGLNKRNLIARSKR